MKSDGHKKTFVILLCLARNLWCE